ncbi:XRE family transcriptional regulator [Limosilactobacillus oris]|uniref:XRE family transcriptional regulator n=1 Tax=Limosilactobacillus oris TaxID=1632 RepID=UPI00242F1E28|nr:XRE family transcriptional regulator [Limosilactobacillus oris]
MSNQNELDDATLDKAIDQAISFDGSPVTEHDRRVMKQLWKEYIKNKKASPTHVENAGNYINRQA